MNSDTPLFPGAFFFAEGDTEKPLFGRVIRVKGDGHFHARIFTGFNSGFDVAVDGKGNVYNSRGKIYAQVEMVIGGAPKFNARDVSEAVSYYLTRKPANTKRPKPSV